MSIAAKLVFLFFALGLIGTAVGTRDSGQVNVPVEDGNPPPPKP